MLCPKIKDNDISIKKSLNLLMPLRLEVKVDYEKDNQFKGVQFRCVLVRILACKRIFWVFKIIFKY